MCRLGVKKLYKYEYISIFPQNRHVQSYLLKRRSMTTVNDYNNYAKHRNAVGCLDQYQTNIEYTAGKWPMCYQALKNETNCHLKELEWVKGGLCIYSSGYCPACRTTLVATRFRVAVICPIIQVPRCIRVFFYFVWFVFINHIFQFHYELCTYCNILDIYLS